MYFYTRYNRFFDAQLSDEIGHLSVRLQQVVLSMLLVSLFTIMMNIFYAHLMGWYEFGFYINWLGWLVLFIGFLGAYKKQPGILLLYMIFMSMFVIYQSFNLLYAFVAGAALTRRLCHNSHCHNLSDSTYAVFWMYLGFSLLWWCVEVYSLKVAKELRYLLKNGTLPTVKTYNYGTNENVPIIVGTAPPQGTGH